VSFTCADRGSLNLDNPSFIRNRKGINLVKLHGGLSELEYNDSATICNLPLTRKSSRELIDDFKKMEQMGYYAHGKKVPSGRDRVITNAKGELDIIRKSMLTGGRKYSRTMKIRVGEEKLQVFDDVLAELDHLTIIGYGFGDQHINFRVSNAMVRNEKFVVQIVDPKSNRTPDFLEQFNYDRRITGAVCGAPDWMSYCNEQKWNTEKTKVLKKNEHLRMDIKRDVVQSMRQWASGAGQ
jgi:hypothetical protein